MDFQRLITNQYAFKHSQVLSPEMSFFEKNTKYFGGKIQMWLKSVENLLPFFNKPTFTACGGEVCLHEGVCVLEENRPEGYNCECLDEFRGRNCEIHSLCEDNGGCQNGATCRVEEERSEVICDCAYGYVGDFCEIGKFVNLPFTQILCEGLN